ncbi:MAG TPA: SprT family zinc-dependent metalloprotease [Candidatus Saccharimonadales bacterium]|nr:SprT family zinc-dependent metalloprotease [Candidatus Saccharimonadales bacterium]
MSSFIDPEFGEIIVHKRRGMHSVHIKIGTDGRYAATAPFYTPLIFIKQVVNNAREDLRKLAAHTSTARPYENGQAIGKTHTLAVVPTQTVKNPTTKILRERLLVYLPPTSKLEDIAVQQQIRDTVVNILRQEAKAYLPNQLATLAKRHGFRYERIRFSHASGRWGSCSSTGTISLNIALMKLPDELIDYVLIHELCHTKHMNHSRRFWAEVEAINPRYRLHKIQIAAHSPGV